MITNGLLITFQCLVDVFALIEMRTSVILLPPLPINQKWRHYFFHYALYTTL